MVEAETLTEVFRDNAHLCSKVSEAEVQHFVSCIEKSRNVKYIKFLQTVVMGGKSGRRVQEMVMNEVGLVPVYWQPIWSVVYYMKCHNALSPTNSFQFFPSPQSTFIYYYSLQTFFYFPPPYNHHLSFFYLTPKCLIIPPPPPPQLTFIFFFPLQNFFQLFYPNPTPFSVNF